LPPAQGVGYPPFEHVVYIIKENRTYDQVLAICRRPMATPLFSTFPARSSTRTLSIPRRSASNVPKRSCDAEVSNGGRRHRAGKVEKSGVAIGRRQIAEHLVVGPVLLDDVDDVLERRVAEP